MPLVDRLGQGWRFSNGFDGMLAETPAACAARFFYDSLVYDPGYLDYLAGSFAPGQVFAGIDYPYVIQQTGLDGFLEVTRTCGGNRTTTAAARYLGIDDGAREHD